MFPFQTQFVRHDTPHPKELKARHPRMLMHHVKVQPGKGIDGNVIRSKKGSFTVSTFDDFSVLFFVKNDPKTTA